MAIDTSMQGRDIWLRFTDESGKVTHSYHRVWDVDRFVAARQDKAAALNKKHGSTKACAALITEQQFKERV